MKFFNKNAPKDGKWDAKHSLGNCNQYNPGSKSWKQYELAYAAEAAEVKENAHQ